MPPLATLTSTGKAEMDNCEKCNHINLSESIRDLGGGLCLAGLSVPAPKNSLLLDLDEPYKLDIGTRRYITRAIVISVLQ
jgi:hypothetical protein